MTFVHNNATLCPSATTVPIQYLFPRCLPCLSRRRANNQTSSGTMDKCKDLIKYAFPDPCLLDPFFFLVLVSTTTSQNIRHFLTLCIRDTTVYEEQLEAKFSRETENMFTLSLYYDVHGIGAIPSSISVKETVVACSFHCGVTTNSIFILTIHISIGGSPGDVSEEPVT